MKFGLKKFGSNEQGVAAIEFAFLAPLFFALMSAVFEISYFVYSNAAAQNAVEEVVFEIRTGQTHVSMAATPDTPPEDWFKEQICNRASIPNCINTIQISMESFDSEFNSTGTDITGGTAQTLIRLEAVIDAPNIAFTDAIFGSDISITAGMTFLTEPY